MGQLIVHARYKGTLDEALCGKEGLSLDDWSETAEEITCPDCHASIPRITPEAFIASLGPALRQLEQEYFRK